MYLYFVMCYYPYRIHRQFIIDDADLYNTNHFCHYIKSSQFLLSKDVLARGGGALLYAETLHYCGGPKYY